MKIRLIDAKGRLGSAVFLLCTLTLFASWSPASEGAPGPEAFFAGLQQANKDLLDLDYFITRNLEAALQGKGAKGVHPILLPATRKGTPPSGEPN